MLGKWAASGRPLLCLCIKPPAWLLSVPPTRPTCCSALRRRGREGPTQAGQAPRRYPNGKHHAGHGVGTELVPALSQPPLGQASTRPSDHINDVQLGHLGPSNIFKSEVGEGSIT